MLTGRLFQILAAATTNARDAVTVLGLGWCNKCLSEVRSDRTGADTCISSARSAACCVRRVQRVIVAILYSSRWRVYGCLCHLDNLLWSWPLTSNRVISKGKWLFTVSFIETAQVLHEIWCSQDSKRPAVTLTFDLQNLIRSSVGTSEYCLSVSSRLLKPFMRYSGIKICPDKWTAQKHNVINIIGWQSHKNHARKIRRGTSKPRFI